MNAFVSTLAVLVCACRGRRLLPSTEHAPAVIQVQMNSEHAARSLAPRMVVEHVDSEALKSFFAIATTAISSSAGQTVDTDAFKSALAIAQATMEPEQFQAVVSTVSTFMVESATDIDSRQTTLEATLQFIARALEQAA